MEQNFISDFYDEPQIITPDDDAHYFFGYYDLRASQGKRHLCHRVQFMDRLPVAEDVAELGYLENVIFISFAFENMVALRELLPEQQLQYLVGSVEEDLVEKLNKYNLDLDIYYPSLTKELLDEVHANGHKVNVWTCDDKEAAEKLVEWGVDFITSNILE